MDSCDVLIVGGGPAGSACAWRLRQGGADVVVMDKATFPRDKVCAGWITPAVLDELQIDLSDYAQSRVLQAITGFLTGVIGGETLQTDYDRTVSYGIRRCEFDEYLLHRSKARLHLGEPLRSFRRERESWIVNDSLRARWLIGAGGHFCPVARHLFAADAASTDHVPVILAQEAEFALTDPQQAACQVSGTHPELYFCPDLKGYGWVFRKGSVLNIGLGREHETQLSEHVAAFVEVLRSRGRITFDIPIRFHGHAYRLRKNLPRVADDGVLLIGDAAGLASPQSGEGIRPSIESGLLAAEAILEAGTNSQDITQRYTEKLKTRMGSAHITEGLTRWLPTPLRAMLGRALLKTRWLTRHVLLDRWFLNVSQQALSLNDRA